jgi:L-ascorbate metabolism protein UlaG (beta-lactamase superfamily)
MRISSKLAVALVFAGLACAHPQAPRARISAATARPAPSAAASPGLEVVYLANEGFLVRHGGRQVLIDALFGDGIPGYDAVSAELRQSLERGAVWGEVPVALATHFHGDHFDPAAVGRFLDAHPAAIFVSTPQAKASFMQAVPDAARLGERFRAVLPDPGESEVFDVAGIRIEALNLHHGRREPPVENLGFIVTLGDRRFIHLGDTEAKQEDLAPYVERLAEPDVALLPFWFLASEWRIEWVRQELRPQRIVVAHLPTPQAPASYFARWRSYAELRATIETAFPDAWLPGHGRETMPDAPSSPAPAAPPAAAPHRERR